MPSRRHTPVPARTSPNAFPGCRGLSAGDRDTPTRWGIRSALWGVGPCDVGMPSTCSEAAAPVRILPGPLLEASTPAHSFRDRRGRCPHAPLPTCFSDLMLQPSRSVRPRRAPGAPASEPRSLCSLLPSALPATPTRPGPRLRCAHISRSGRPCDRSYPVSSPYSPLIFLHSLDHDTCDHSFVGECVSPTRT